VNYTRKQLFTQIDRTLENIPPTHDVLMQHSKRSAYQAGHVLSPCLLTDPGNCGRIMVNIIEPLWVTLPMAAGCCHNCIVHAKLVAKLDFVSVFGLNYIAVLFAGVETTVRILMINSCDSVGTGSSDHGSRVNCSTILAGLGQVTGQGDRPSV